MVGDVLCAVLPIAIIWRLSHSTVERVLVTVLLGLGLVAAVGGVLKVVILKSWVPTSPNANRELMQAFIWYVERIRPCAARPHPVSQATKTDKALETMQRVIETFCCSV